MSRYIIAKTSTAATVPRFSLTATEWSVISRSSSELCESLGSCRDSHRRYKNFTLEFKSLEGVELTL